MISKERLEELIKERATIWSDNHCPINLINDSKHKIQLLANALYVAEEFENCAHTHTWWNDYAIGFDDLYENEEDSKWAEEFSYIERTERLELPTWEDVSKDFIPLKVASGQYPIFSFSSGNLVYEAEVIVRLDKTVDIVMMDESWMKHFHKPLTKENYTFACRKAKELFLGE